MREVIINVENHGGNFAGIVLDARTRRKLHTCDPRPSNFVGAAMRDAESWARSKGYRIVKDEDLPVEGE